MHLTGLEDLLEDFGKALQDLRRTIETINKDTSKKVNQDLPPLFHHKGGPDNDQ
jgi:hypothetical protein